MRRSKTGEPKMNMPDRIVFGSGSRGSHAVVPEILEIGWGRFSVANRGHLRPHAHVGAFEVCLILSGEVEWSTATSLDILREGDVYVTQPNEEHWGLDSVMHPCTLHWLILGSPEHDFAWSGLDSGLANYLHAQLRGIRSHRLRATSKLLQAFRELFEEHKLICATPEQQLLRQGYCRSTLHQLLIELARICDRQNTTHAQDRTALPVETARALELLSRGGHDPALARQSCERIGIDYKTLNDQFIEHLGASVLQYCLRQRVRLARERLLSAETTVTDIALELGFASGQHFATVFRKVTGLTPSQYRKASGATS